ncbi:MAG: hypothetical protein ACI8UO_003998 [Verrucomicrobiales bacterium]
MIPIASIIGVIAFAADGLPNADHWAYQPLMPIEPSAGVHPIDGFVGEHLEQAGLKSNPPADRRTLIRRLYFDLHGLPPTPEAIDSFLADSTDDDAAVASLIQQLLGEPAYGERWARHWLDVVRYSESQGFERDKFRPNFWHYRDYVIQSFNSDKPYKRFAQEQVAGDVLQPFTKEAIIATGFLVAGPWDEVGNSQKSQVMKRRVREEDLEDVIAVVGQTFLGVTINCARCHDHKFDPISAKDYYAFKAVFEGIRHGERDAFGEKVYAANRQDPGPTHFLERGDTNLQGEVIAPAGLSALSGDLGLAPTVKDAERRLKFAEWLTAEENPLFARTIVNRIWHYHFGAGLVKTPNDLGVSGGDPSHPELLDWLAAEFVRQGYSLKKLHTLILTSQTWRQSSDSQPAAAEKDADNRLLWRFAPKRLEAEAMRDSMLAISGELNRKVGGPSVQPFDLVIDNTHFYTFKDSGEPEFNRRTIYRAQIASLRDSLMDSLDCPSIGLKAPARSETATPVQALSLMNNSFVDRQCQKFAERLVAENPRSFKAQIKRAFLLALGRSPTAEEMEKSVALRGEHSLEEVCWALLNSTEFIFVR